MDGRRLARAAIAAIALMAASSAAAQEARPADTLLDLRRQFAGCLSRTALDASGSLVTIAFMTKRDGSIFGRPRIAYSHLEGDREAQRRFLGEAERAIDSCLPLKVTPALGAAIAGRMFSITLGRRKPESGV